MTTQLEIVVALSESIDLAYKRMLTCAKPEIAASIVCGEMSRQIANVIGNIQGATPQSTSFYVWSHSDILRRIGYEMSKGVSANNAYVAATAWYVEMMRNQSETRPKRWEIN